MRYLGIFLWRTPPLCYPAVTACNQTYALGGLTVPEINKSTDSKLPNMPITNVVCPECGEEAYVTVPNSSAEVRSVAANHKYYSHDSKCKQCGGYFSYKYKS
jgi:rRNA maturation protein Nop10